MYKYVTVIMQQNTNTVLMEFFFCFLLEDSLKALKNMLVSSYTAKRKKKFLKIGSVDRFFLYSF